MLLPTRTFHQYKKVFQKNRITLWQLAELTGYSVASLSDFLNQTRPMPEWVERRLTEVVREVGA